VLSTLPSPTSDFARVTSPVFPATEETPVISAEIAVEIADAMAFEMELDSDNGRDGITTSCKPFCDPIEFIVRFAQIVFFSLKCQ
jgi:hypothetical protein